MAWLDRRPSLHGRPLSHRNSASSIRRPLSHRNSTSSIHGHPNRNSIDAEIGRRDATAAAQYAYARAEERKSLNGTDLGFSNGIGLSRANSSAAQSVATVRRSDSNKFVEHGGVYTPGSGGSGLRRQQSVRFAGPNAIPRRQSLIKRQSQDQFQPQHRPFSHARIRAVGSITTLRPRALTVEVAVPAEYRPPSRSSSIGKSSLGRAHANGKRGGDPENFITALAESAVYDEYYAITNEDDVASTPSSYRRIRRSKSMFSPGKTKSAMSATKDRKDMGSIQYNNDTPSPMELRRSQSFLNRGAAGLKIQKSMSFLRGGREKQRVSRDDQDAAVAIARDKFLHQVQQQRLREQPSFLFRANKRREEHSSKPFRKSVRSGSGNSAPLGQPVSSEDYHSSSRNEEMKTLKGKARKVSKSFRKKIKGFFKRGSGDSEEATIPDQQVTSHETHAIRTSPYPSGASDICHGTPYNDIPCPTPEKIYSVAARVGSLHANPSTQQLRSRTGSVQSLRSDGSGTASNCSKSRVTSWTSTDTVTSANSRHAQIERERQRLSIIQENGTHISSSSFSRPALQTQFSAYPLVERANNTQFQGEITQPVDSQRVYSALMKRLDENSPQTDVVEQSQRQISQESLVVPPRNGSLRGRHGALINNTPATIRAVPPSATTSTTSLSNDEAKTMGFKPCQANECDDVFSPEKNISTTAYTSNDINAHRKKASGSVSSQYTLILKKPNYSAFPLRESGDSATFFTPQQIADRIEGGRSRESKSTAVLRETKSTFFPHCGGTIQRTNSPFQRALAASDYKPDWKSDYKPPDVHGNRLFNDSVSPTLTVKPGSTCKVVENSALRGSGYTAYSESVYSRATGDDFEEEPKPNRRGSGSGTAVLIEREVYRPTHRPNPLEPGNNLKISHRLASSSGSIEWKKWMSAEVAALEQIKEPETAMRITYALPSMPKAFGADGESPSAKSSIGHVREKAQITDDDTCVRQGKAAPSKQPLGIIQSLCPGGGSVTDASISYSLKAPPVLQPKSILKKSSQASISTIFTDTVTGPSMAVAVPPVPAIPPAPITRVPLRQTQSRASLKSVSSAGTVRAPSSVGNTASILASSLDYKFGMPYGLKERKSSATLKSMENFTSSGNKLVKKMGGNVSKMLNPSTAGSEKGSLVSPGGLGVAVEKQFGSGRRSTSLQGGVDENVNPTGVKRFQSQVHGLVSGGSRDGDMLGMGMGRGAREIDGQIMGSKRMVDLFLSSRRRKVAGSEEDGGSGAFL